MYAEQFDYERLSEELVRLIQKGELHGGDPIASDAEISKQIGIRRKNVKKAIGHLQATGVLERKNGTELCLAEDASHALSQTLHILLLLKNVSPLEVCQMRRMMDTTALKLAFERLAQLNLEELQDYLDQIQFGNVLNSIRADEQTHLWLMEASGNQLMVSVMQAVWAICSTQMNLLLTDGTEELHRKQAVVHEQLYKSFLREDLKLGLEAIQVHYDTIEEHLRNCSRKPSYLFSQTGRGIA